VTAVLVVRVLLVGVFAVAALTKLTDRDGVREMVVEFGAPARLAAWLAWALILTEGGVAVALAVGPTVRIGSWIALALLIAFGAVVAVMVGRGRQPECHCFGRVQASPVGWSTVSRNVLLATGAGFVAAEGRLWLQKRQSDQLRPGAPAPPLVLADVAGTDVALESLLAAGRRLLLVFGDPDCGACLDLMPKLAEWQGHAGGEVTVALVSGGDPAQLHALAEQFGRDLVLSDPAHAAAGAYGITATPTAVLVDQEQRIAAAPATGEAEIAELVASATAAERGFERRALLTRAAASVATVTVAPFVESLATAGQALARVKRPKILHIDGAWLCDQRYALCTSAKCQPSKTRKNISVCRCRVKTGYSVGFKTCQKRAPRGRQLHSNFSLQDVTKHTRTLKCSERGLWAQCLDVVCEVDPKDPKHATCQCVNERTKNYYTFGGNCDTKTCKTVIWSATTAPFPGGTQLEKGLRRLGIPFRLPSPCPTKK
jgi:thiol-disulfide isomerase/thioredoxin